MTGLAGDRRAARAARLARCAAIVLALCILAAGRAQPAPSRLLVVTHSAGYEHEVVRRPPRGGLSLVERAITELGQGSGGFGVTRVATRDELAGLTPAVIQAHQGVLFFTTGELPMTPAVREAIFRRVREGAGFIGVHSATDTWYTVPEYHEMVGGTFDGHPWHGPVALVVEDRTHPATRGLGDAVKISDEIYQFRDWSREHVHVLLRLDPRSVDVARGKRADHDYALAWTRRHGRGRVVYTALGHEPAVWSDERFRAHLLGAIEWAMAGS